MMSNARRSPSAQQIAALFAVLLLAGCASTFDVLPQKMGGLPADAPSRPVEAAPYPNVYAPDPRREVAKLSEDEQKTAELELLALREGANQRANPQPLEPERPKKKPAARKPDKKKVAAKEAAKKSSPASPPAAKQKN